MQDVLIFGVGKIAREIERFLNFDKIRVIAYSDNNKEVWYKKRKLLVKNRIEIIDIIPPEEIQKKKENTWIIMASSYYEKIKKQLLSMDIEQENILICYHILETDYDKRLEKVLKKSYFEKEDNYEIEGFNLNLGEGHTLARTIKRYPMYDRFVSQLALLENEICDEEKRGKNFILDIGANVGDTTLAMIKYTDSSIIAVEPTKLFFNTMKKNIEDIEEKYARRIQLVNAYISNDEEIAYISSISKGTAFKVRSTGTVETPTYTVKTLLEICKVMPENVSLIKVDTDGYDSECIMSCEDILSEHSPLLYWENEVNTVEQYHKFIGMCKYLQACQYTDFFVFDNFGNFLLRTNIEGLQSINSYLARINESWGERTFFYVDILACKENISRLCYSIIQKYLDKFPIERYV